jgi:hypothetical protein
VENDVFMNWRGRASPLPATPARVERTISAELNRFWVTASGEQYKRSRAPQMLHRLASNAAPERKQRKRRKHEQGQDNR